MKSLRMFMMALVPLLLFACSSDDSDSQGSTPTTDSVPEDVLKYELTQNTVILQKNVISQITEADTIKQVLFFKNVDLSALPAVGSCFIINTPTDVLPSGLLAKIEAVQQENGGCKMTYSNAELTDAFQNLQLEQYNIDLAKSAVKFFDAEGNERPLVKTRAATSQSFSVTIPDLEWSLGEDLSMTPHFSIEMLMDIDLYIKNCFLRKFNTHFVVTPSLGADFSLSADNDIVDKRIRVGSIICGAIPVGPVVLNPVIDLFFIFKLSGKVSLEGSVSYKRTVDLQTKYSLASENVLDATIDHYLPEDGGWKSSLGGKLEGSFSYGLGTGPACTVYGKVLYTGVSVDCLLKESVNGQLNLLEASTQEGFDFFKFNGMEYKHDFTAKGHFYVGSFGKDKGKDTPELSFNISTCKVLPPVGKEVQATVKGKKATLSITAEGLCLFPYKLIGRFIKKNAGKDDQPIESYFQFTDEIQEQLEAGKKTTLTAEANLDAGEYSYYVIARVKVGEEELDFNITNGEVVPEAATDAETALRNILADIYSSRNGDWKGCNWDKEDTPISDLKNVEYVKTWAANYIITIPEDWKIKDSGIDVGNQTKLVNADIADWELHIKGNRKIDHIVIDDHSLWSVSMDGGSVNTLALRNSEVLHSGNMFDDEERVFKADVIETIDVSKSSASRLIFYADGVKFGKLPKNVIAENCPKITQIKLIGDEENPTKYKAPKVVAYDCEKLDEVDAEYLTIPYMALERVSSNTTNQFHLTLRGCTIEEELLLTGTNYQYIQLRGCSYPKITADPSTNIQAIHVWESKGNSITIKECPNLKTLEVIPYYTGTSQVKSLVVKDCPVLEKLSAFENDGLSKFDAANLPSLKNLNVRKNKSLTGEILPLFLEMKERGVPTYNIVFDWRYYSYERNSDGSVKSYKDLGYGYYYPEEPKVYHASW